jgi:hypothetical protein
MADNSDLDLFVSTTLGADVLVKLNHQSIGGDNNQKGNNHENFFAVYKLAKFYFSAKNELIEISSQDKAFVDDLVVLWKDRAEKRSYQLKDSKKVYWHKAKGITPYFTSQSLVDKDFYGMNSSKTVLVLANKSTFDLRAADIPASISSHTECMHFPNTSLNQMLMGSDVFRTAIGKLCCFPDEIDKLTTVASILAGVWVSRDLEAANDRDVYKLVERAKTQAAPDYFIDEESAGLTLEDEITTILDKVVGFSYQLSAGFLVYDFGAFHGSVKFKIGTEDFVKLCDVLKDQRPTTARDLVMLLMGSGDRA